jgi:hypothetical protein
MKRTNGKWESRKVSLKFGGSNRTLWRRTSDGTSRVSKLAKCASSARWGTAPSPLTEDGSANRAFGALSNLDNGSFRLHIQPTVSSGPLVARPAAAAVDRKPALFPGEEREIAGDLPESRRSVQYMIKKHFVCLVL